MFGCHNATDASIKANDPGKKSPSNLNLKPKQVVFFVENCGDLHQDYAGSLFTTQRLSKDLHCECWRLCMVVDCVVGSRANMPQDIVT